MGRVINIASTDLDGLLMKIERNQSMVFKFIKQLNSYTCEPTDYDCFVIVGRLKHELQQLAVNQKELLVKDRKTLTQNKKTLKTVKQYLEKFEELKIEMEEYLKVSRSHR